MTYILSLPFILGIYWVLWKLYLWASPHLISDDAPEYLKRPKYWQFAIVLFVISFLSSRNKK